MSKGHGRVQRAILADLAEAGDVWGVPWSSVYYLATVVYGTDDPTDSQIVSVRRDVRRLRDEGAVEVRSGGPFKFGVRRLLSDEERADEERRKAARDERWRVNGRLRGEGGTDCF